MDCLFGPESGWERVSPAAQAVGAAGGWPAGTAAGPAGGARVGLAERGPNLLPGDGEAYLYGTFLDPGAAEVLLVALTTELDWRQETAHLFGRDIPLPRLTAWYGDVGYRYSGVTHPPAPWPAALDELRHLVGQAVPLPNSALANLYRDGRDSVSWHADDEAEFGPQPVIASISLGATRRFVLRHRRTQEQVRVDLPHGSLLVMAGDCQHCWQHAIPKSSRAMGTRINLTFRRIVASDDAGPTSQPLFGQPRDVRLETAGQPSSHTVDMTTAITQHPHSTPDQARGPSGRTRKAAS